MCCFNWRLDLLRNLNLYVLMQLAFRKRIKRSPGSDILWQESCGGGAQILWGVVHLLPALEGPHSPPLTCIDHKLGIHLTSMWKIPDPCLTAYFKMKLGSFTNLQCWPLMFVASPSTNFAMTNWPKLKQNNAAKWGSWEWIERHGCSSRINDPKLICNAIIKSRSWCTLRWKIM